ncbi:MAG: Mur ligase family protein, partial [Bacteroidota bacterium]
AEIEAERNPALLALREAAAVRGVAFLPDDDFVSVGLGTGSQTWPVSEIPDPEAVDWPEVHDIPVALVTGTNGKSTTVRLTAAMAQAAGRTAGRCSTDFVRVGDTVVERGDWSGPGGARAVLRHTGAELAILETARGGMLRRGLALSRAEVALVTNVGEDHLGDYGILTLDDLVEVKLTIRRAVESDGVLVLNADDDGLVRHARDYSGTVCWFSLDPDNPVLAAHRRAGGRTCSVEDGEIVWTWGDAREVVLPVADIPIALGGAAKHNVANALAAVALAKELGLPTDAIRAGLQAFRGDAADNPGRGNYFEIGGAKVLVDFAHNPHGVGAIADTARALPAERRLVLIGQAGDRTDAEIRGLARAAWRADPDHVLIAALADYRRGRETGEVPALLDDELHRLGAPSEHVTHVSDPIAGVRAALDWMQPGDLLLLFVLSQRDEAFAVLREAQAHAASVG